ncbi:Dolichyl N-acetyl-alpha-D-glucosaminyl phosphate 3-beta-D-2,3-diacetamido-2,3-dideoxy-beta-D-glucuronosyltransferase [Candidatus Tiddalikarchaeum anstoanum]|nr:Dolichyl N-acetyl-alpha-D-glucosaminyl phosphate 3-beta-D-2,3-diacetamido-2,3-dideoxy-beta-D-glucuronosyltransferase [Candidatus Tiddalikarchaeum anstoanum]
MTKNVSVVILARNEEDKIKDCIISIKNSSYKNLEIILIDSFSNDNTIKVAKKIRGVSIYKMDAASIGAALKSGINLAKGELVFIVNGDSTVSREFISEAVKLFDNPDIAVVSGKRVEKNQDSLIGRMYTQRFKNDKFGFVSKVSGNYMFRKNVILKYTELDETVTAAEEHYISLKVTKEGYKIYRINKVSMYHNSKGDSSSILDLIKKHNWYAIGKRNVFNKLSFSEKISFFDQDFFLTPWILASVIAGFYNTILISMVILPFLLMTIMMLIKGYSLDIAVTESVLAYFRSISLYFSSNAASNKVKIEKII